MTSAVRRAGSCSRVGPAATGRTPGQRSAVPALAGPAHTSRATRGLHQWVFGGWIWPWFFDVSPDFRVSQGWPLIAADGGG